MQSPESISKPQDVAHRDKIAAQDIERLQWYIDRLTDYRQALALRYAELETMPYHHRLKLRRHRCYDGHKEYYLTIDRILQYGSAVNELREVYPGKERHRAIARFNELKKARPGIETELDISKSNWEK